MAGDHRQLTSLLYTEALALSSALFPLTVGPSLVPFVDARVGMFISECWGISPSTGGASLMLELVD